MLAVADMNDAGFRVVFDGEDSYLEDKKTKEKIPILYRRRVFEIELEVEPYAKNRELVASSVNALAGKTEKKEDSVFGRQPKRA